MKVIITGGSGLIGRALTASLAADDHEVIILSRTPERVSGLPNGARAEAWNGKTAEGWGHLVEGAGAIVNLAGAGVADGRWTEDRKRLILDSRVNAGNAIVEAVRAAKSKPNVVLQSSAVGYYGPHGIEDVTEQTPPGDDYLAGVCQAWEASTAEIGNLGIRRIELRSGVVLSMDGGALPKMIMPFQFFAGGPIGSGRQRVPWIHIDDEVGAIRFLIDKETSSGPFNLTAPTPLSNAEFGRVIGKVMGRPAFVPTPAFAMKLLFGEMSTVLLDGQCAKPFALLEAGYQFKFPDAESALRDLLK